MYKEDLALNNLQGLICHKTHQPNPKFPIKSSQQLLFACVLLLVVVVLWVFHTNVSWGSFTEIWVTASLFRSLGLSWVFKPISTMPRSELSRFLLWFPDPQFFGVFFKPLRTNHNWYHRHFYVPRLFQFSNKVQVFVYLFAFFYFHSVVPLNGKIYGFFFSY